MLSVQMTLAQLALMSAVGYLPSGSRWSAGQIPVRHCISPNATSTSLSASQQQAAVTSAINQWRNSEVGGGTSCTTYDAVASTSQCATIRASDGQNNIYWVRNWQQGSQVIGVTWSSSLGACGTITDGTGRQWNLDCKSDADIEFNDRDYTWTTNGSSGTDVGSIAVHEYGHFIGLDHCNDNMTCNLGTAVMYAAYPGGAIRVPYNDDIEGNCTLYPGTQGGTGWPCTQAGDCTTSICVSPSANGYCSQTCGSCPTGYSCRANPQNAAQMVCLRDDGTNHALCETCTGIPNACANGGVCVGGLPEANGGRCSTPCPNPSAMNGGCPNLYGCYQLQNASGSYCLPMSRDCTNLTNIPPAIVLGQTCNGDPPCASGLDCIGICSPTCTGAPNQGSCPAGYACAEFKFQDGTTHAYCAPPVREGQGCAGITACTGGHCLASGQGVATCYKDCAGNPSACNNAQECSTYALQGGGQVSVCEPPGVPPRPDAGIPPDTGIHPDADDSGMTMSGDDSGVACACDTTAGSCDPGCDCDPDCGASAADAGMQQIACTCDMTTACDTDCACDPECRCDCDATFGCDPDCACDPECRPATQKSGCSVLGGPERVINRRAGDETTSEWAIFGLWAVALGILGRRRLLR
jgi:matrixin